jgi:protease IV
MRLLASLAIAAATSGCLTVDLGALSQPKYQEFVVEARDVEPKVAMVTVSGMMSSDTEGFLFERQSIIAATQDQLQLAAADPAVRAVVLRISSPGGDIYPSMAIHRMIQRFRKETQKPVIAYTPDVAASGGYMAALAADAIIADPAALTGSVGVIAILPEVSGLLNWAQVKVNVVKTGARKDLGSPFRELTEEDRAQITRIIDHYFGLFKTMLADARPKMTADQRERVLLGDAVAAPDALSLGLVDSIGDFESAYEEAARRAGLNSKQTQLVIYRRPGEYAGSVYVNQLPSQQPGLNLSLNLADHPGTRGVRMMYLWALGT